MQGCVFTQDINQAIYISDAMETGTVQINSAPARGPDHFPFQGFRDSGIGSQVRGLIQSVRTLFFSAQGVLQMCGKLCCVETAI